MFLVVDVNVIISAILNKGDSVNVFAFNNLVKKFDFVAPEFILIELGKHTDEIAKRTNLTQDEVKEVLEFISKQITFIPEYQFKDKVNEARDILRGHEKDAPYLALALTLDCNIFSGDKVLKKICPEKVKTPKELLEEFYK